MAELLPVNIVAEEIIEVEDLRTLRTEVLVALIVKVGDYSDIRLMAVELKE